MPGTGEECGSWEKHCKHHGDEFSWEENFVVFCQRKTIVESSAIGSYSNQLDTTKKKNI